MGVELAGRHQLDATMQQAVKDLDDLKAAHDEAGHLVATASKPATPRRTGRLANLLRSSGAPGEATIEDTANYAVPVHGGVPSRHIKAQPFITHTAERIQPAWVDVYTDHVQQVLDTVKGA